MIQKILDRFKKPEEEILSGDAFCLQEHIDRTNNMRPVYFPIKIKKEDGTLITGDEARNIPIIKGSENVEMILEPSRLLIRRNSIDEEIKVA